MIGRTDWFDIPVADLADAMSFYEGLLGWSFKQMDNSPLASYVMIDVGGKLIGGLRKTTAGSPAEASAKAGPVLYFTVDILAPKVARAKELGAAIVGEMVDLGEDRGRYQWIKDRAGNTIALWAAK